MCKDCENNINKNEELEQENVSLEDMDKEQLLDIVYSLLEQKDKEIDINVDDLNDITIDKSEFKKGIKQYSAIAGAFTVLNSVGYPKDLIHEMILNDKTIQHNQQLQQMNNESSEKIAKIQEVKIEQSQIQLKSKFKINIINR